MKYAKLRKMISLLVAVWLMPAAAAWAQEEAALPAQEWSMPIVLPYTSRTITYPHLTIEKTATIRATTTVDGQAAVPWKGRVDYQFKIKNTGGAAYWVTVFDHLYNAAEDALVAEQQWYFEEIGAGEEVVIDYIFDFGEASAPGRYSGYAWFEARQGDSFEQEKADYIPTNVASTTVFLASPGTEIREAETDAEEQEMAPDSDDSASA